MNDGMFGLPGAVAAGGALRTTVFTTGTGTFTPIQFPCWLHFVLVGGGGSGADGSNYYQSGGGGGETVMGMIRLLSFQTVSYAVGAGGAAVSTASGNAGGNTNIFGRIYASGGGGGISSGSVNYGGAGGGYAYYSGSYDDGASGTQLSEHLAVSRGLIAVCGGAGGAQISTTGLAGLDAGWGDPRNAGLNGAFVRGGGAAGGNYASGGGNSLYGKGGAAGYSTGGSAGTGYGAGGGGNYSTGSSGAGTGGLIILTEYA